MSALTGANVLPPSPESTVAPPAPTATICFALAYAAP
jgi:hypothetical protein